MGGHAPSLREVCVVVLWPFFVGFAVGFLFCIVPIVADLVVRVVFHRVLCIHDDNCDVFSRPLLYVGAESGMRNEVDMCGECVGIYQWYNVYV